MKRTEQIRQASIEYTYRNRPMCIGGGSFSEMVDEMNRNKPFEEGAKWADETMIEKACEWLNSVNTDDYMDSGIFQMYDLIIDFKKAMGGDETSTL